MFPAAVTRQIDASAAAAGGFRGFYRENKWYVWAVVVGVLIIAALSYFAFRKTPAQAPKGANVGIAVDVPQTVPAGSQAVYKITVTNKDTQKLVQMTLELAYPDGETFVESSPNPQNLSGTLFSVPDLNPGQNAVVMVKARINGNVNDTKDLLIKLHYHYSNFNAEFVQKQDSTIRLVASDIQLDLNGPQQTSNAQLVVYTLKYQNNSSHDIQNARVVMHYDSGFAFASAQPQPDSGTDTWNIGTLAAGSSGTITIQGTFNAANPGESKTATADFQVLGNDGQYYVQGSSAPVITAINSLPLLVSQSVSGVDPSVNVVDPGQTLTFNLKYQNNASTVATGVNIIVTLDSKALDLASIQAEGGQVNNNTITWNASSVNNLQSLNPSDNGQLAFTVKVKNPATKDSSKDLTIVSNLKISSNEYQTAFPGNQVSLKVSSPVTLNSAVSYQSGSLPPKVGQATLYAVSLSLTNSTDDMSNGVLTAYVPLGAGGFANGSVNSGEASNVQYDSSTGKLTWQVDSLPAHTGQFTRPRVLSFGLRLIPSASQANQAPTLLKNIQFTATDTFTGQTVNAAADDLSTSSVGGQNGYYNSAVQP